MPVKDDPNTRIKAADAQALYRSSAPADHLCLLGQERGFLTLAAIKLDAQAEAAPWALPWGWTDADVSVMEAYLKGLTSTCPPQFSAARGMLLFGIHANGIAEVATYGATAGDCKRLGVWGGIILEELPVAPFQTWWGYGNDGVPKRMSSADLETLTPNHRAYVERYTHPSALAA